MNAVRRQSRALRILRHRVVPAIVLLVCVPGVALGQDRLRLREIEVPAGRPELWPAGDWRPLAAKDYRRLVETVGEREPRPRDVWIERAEYTATLVDDTLAEGSLTAQVRRQGNEARFLETGPTGLAISDLHWVDGQTGGRDAVWGRSPDGETAIFVDRDGGTLQGRWTLRGERLGRGIHFDLQVAQADANSLRMRLPADAALQSSCGFVSGSPEVGDDGLREWRVDLGSRVQCRLTVIADSAGAMQPVVLSEVETTGAAREDGLHFQAKVSLEVLHGPIRTVSVLIPRDLDVYSVTYGELPLTWRARPANGKKRLQMELPDPLVGKSRSLRIHAIAPIRTGRDREVPRLSVEGAFFGASQVHLEVEQPLELQDLQLHGSRQVATVARGGQGASYTFEEFRPDARITVRLGRPRLNLSAEVVTHLSAAPQDWTLSSEVRLKCVSGSTFSATIVMPPGWDVTEVRASGSTAGGNLLNWDVRRARGQSRVVLEFAESFDSGESNSVEIFARRRAEPGFARETAILLPQPQRAQVSEMVVGVTYPAAESLEVRHEEPFEVIEEGRVAAETADGPAWRAFEAARAENRSVVLRATNPRQGTRMTVERQSPPFGARAHVIAEFDGEQVTEQFAIEISPEGESVASVRVYCSTQGPEPAWRIVGEEENLVAARRLPAGEHSRWGLPAEGELWEITPAAPLRNGFTIAGTRTRRIQPGGGVLLAVVPEGADFEGTVELKGVQGRLPEFEARGPQRVDGAPVTGAAGASASIQRWRYRSLNDSLQVASLPGSGAERTDRTARLHLTSRVSAPDGADLRHQARFETGRLRAPGRFRFELPASCSLLRATIDGEPVSITRQGPEYVLPVMPAGRPHLVEIDYRSPVASGLLSVEQRVPVPTSRFEILRFDWECLLPDGIELSVAPSGVRVHDPPAVASWSERLFGPLGRPQGSPAFNLLSARAWSELLFGPGRRERARGGQVAHRASAPTSPEMLTFETWNRSHGRAAAWVVFLATLFIGLVLRLSRLRGRMWVASVWLATALASAWILPAGWSEIAGAAIAGALLAIVVPGPLIRARPRADRESPSIGSTETVSYGRAAAGSALVALVLLRAVGPAFAQEIPSPAAGNRIEYSVLIPVDPSSEPTTVVFVSRELWERSLTIREDRREYLISSAVYEADIDSADSANVRATYRVAAVGEAGSPRIVVPITGAHLAGPNACRVNGTVHPVLPAADGGGFVIAPSLVQRNDADNPSGEAADAPVDAVVDGHLLSARRSADVPVRWLEIQLDLRVPITASPTGGRFEIGVPAVPSARASLSLKRAHATVEVLAARGRKVVSAEGRRVTAELGGISRLQVVWSSEDRVDQSPETEVSIATRIDAQPTRLQMRSRVSYQVKRGTVHSLLWEVPREMVPRTITLGRSEPISGWFLSPAGEGKLHLHIPLAIPRTQDFTVEATFTLPVRSDGGEIVVPPLDLLAPHPDHERMAYRHQVGIGSTALYRVATPSMPSDALASLSAETFLAEFGRGGSAAGVERPGIAWRLQRPAELRFRLIPVVPQRRVWSSQIGHIGAAEISWTARVELETNAAPAFRHRLSVSPNFEIDSISVHEDEVDRLARWSRDGESVILHLSDRTTGVQNIMVNGRMALGPSGATPLPLVGVDNAEIVDSRLHLYRSPAVDVELSAAAELETLAGPLSPPDERRASLPLGQYRLPPGKAAPGVLVRPADGASAIESVTGVRPRGDGSLDVRTLIRLGQPAGAARPVRVALPPVLADLKVVQGRRASYEFETGANGGSRLLIMPDSGAGGPPEVALTASISPVAEGEWIVPVPSNSGAEQGAGFFVIAAGDPLALDESSGTAVDPGAIPGWVAQAEAFRSAGTPVRTYRTSAQEWRVRRSGPGPSAGPLISLFDTELWASSAGPVYGTTEMVVPPLDEPVSIRLQWPEGVRLRSLGVEGEQARSIEPRSGVLEVPLDAAPVPQVVTIDWVARATTHWWPLTRTGVRMPVPQEGEVEVALVAVRAQGRPWLARQTVLGEADRTNDLDRVEGLLDACRDADAGLLGETAAFAELSRLADRLSQDGASASARPVREANRLAELVVESTSRGGARRSPQSTVGDSPLFAGRPVRLDAELMWWTVDRAVVSWGLLLLGAAVALPLAMWFVRSRPSRWLQSRPAAALAILGVVWWACLRPSFLGLAILAAAAVLAWRGRTQQRREEPAALQFE